VISAVIMPILSNMKEFLLRIVQSGALPKAMVQIPVS
jgi:hypothetical protein